VRVRFLLLAVAAVIAAFTTTGTAAAVPPAPCGAAQIADAAGDGHHAGTDVLEGWFSEQAGRLQAVIRVQQGLWVPEHDDAPSSGYALLFDFAGQRRYVRVEAPRGAPVRFDHGTWTRSEGFVSAGPTGGEVVTGNGGTAALDVPAYPGLAAGSVLAQPMILTYDGLDSPTELHWVDRAPGGETPDGTEYGADYVLGSCQGTGQPGQPSATTSVVLSAPRRLVGGGKARVTGTVAPARAGVPVTLTSTAGRRSVDRRLTTGDGGRFSVTLPVSETTRLRAVAEGIGSQTRTVTVVSTIRIKVRRLRGGGALVTGRVRPALPGRVLLLRTTSSRPSARATPRRGQFRIRMRNPRRGRYQAVYVPSGRRAERSTSNTGTIR
jgi:hypothetical protein